MVVVIPVMMTEQMMEWVEMSSKRGRRRSRRREGLRRRRENKRDIKKVKGRY